MPTPLDKVTNSKGLFLGFAGIISAAAAWSIWGSGQLFPSEPDPQGDPQTWTDTELRRWLQARNLYPSSKSTRAELIARVEANMRPPARNQA